MVPPLYARYIPPPPPNEPSPPRSRNGIETPSTANEAARPGNSASKTKDPKKQKKEKNPGADSLTEDKEVRNGRANEKTSKIPSREKTSMIPSRDKPKSDHPNIQKPTKKRKRVESTEQGTQSNGLTTSIEPGQKHHATLAKFHQSRSAVQTSTRDDGSASPSQKTADDSQIEGEVAHGLQPLPQPVPIDEPAPEAAFSALPPWLARPVVADSTNKTPFAQFEISPKTIAALQSHGYHTASAIQSIVLPLLLPGPQRCPSDLCISAATGSGKTLAYVLPMLEDLRSRVVTRLRGLVVVPTRELVTQVRSACELVAMGLHVGTAVGNQPFAVEQGLLVQQDQRYDPSGREELQQRLNKPLDEDDELDSDEFDEESHSQLLPGHVLEYRSKVDVLICTPGRLVDHLRGTPGFTLDHLRWLVVDEADRLLGQSFQEWLPIVMGELRKERSWEELDMAERIRHLMGAPRAATVRKVILSATLTRDMGKLNGLELQRPRLVVVDQDASVSSQNEPDAGLTFQLPESLQEWAVAIPDGSKKPLCLLLLLRRQLCTGVDRARKGDGGSSGDGGSDESDESDSDTSSSEESSAKSSSASSDGELERSSSLGGQKTEQSERTTRGVLVFTKSNEAALRLSRLLVLLQPDLTQILGTMTSTHAFAKRRKILRAFKNSSLEIIVASDLVARGMDLPGLAHVVNYDAPGSVTAYVHRVGRTARAGQAGEAWTLLADREARWFWHEIARGGQIRRADGRQVRRRRVEVGSEPELEERYEAALKTLGDEVQKEGGRGSG